MKDIIGNRYGMLTVIERAGKVGSVQLIKCLCDCGNTCIVRYPNLTSGITSSCGCLKRKLSSERFLKDLTGKTFGELTVKSRASAIGGKKVDWICKCTCGSTCICTGSNLKSGNTTSCGCMRASVNEGIIINYLRHYGAVFEKEAKFKDLVAPTGRPLRFDFKIYTVDGFFLLEYQGEQHFKPDTWSDIGRTSREYTDIMKLDYCKKNKINLEFITYIDDTIIKLDYILSKYNILYVDTVPSSQETA